VVRKTTATIDLADVPSAPGAYLLLDARERPLYVGRAGNLRQRVRSYWAPSLKRIGLRGMVKRVRRVLTVTTGSEHEAAFLERVLLERYDPPFNHTLGVESVVAIALGVSSVRAVHERPATPGVRYFGPYLGWTPAFGAASALARAFPLYLCRPASELTSVERDLARRRGVGEGDAATLTASIVAVLERDATVLAHVVRLTEEARDNASELRLFERAAELHGEIAGLQWITQPQALASFRDDGTWHVDDVRLPVLPSS
jgi:excinuclease ABC subunit C